MSDHKRCGASLAAVGAVVGIVAGLWLFVSQWQVLYQAEMAAGRPDEAMIVTWILPALSDLILIGGVLWALAAYGLVQRARWGWSIGVTAAVVSLVGGFFWMIPAASRGVFPWYVIIFVTDLTLFLAFVLRVRPQGVPTAILTLFMGMAYVLCVMNGIASTDRIMVTQGAPVYVAVQRLNWVAGVAWAVSLLGVLHRTRWAWPAGLGAGLLAVTAGTPLAWASSVAWGRFSMFSLAPLMSLGLLVTFLLPRVRRWYDAIVATPEGRPASTAR